MTKANIKAGIGERKPAALFGHVAVNLMGEDCWRGTNMTVPDLPAGSHLAIYRVWDRPSWVGTPQEQYKQGAETVFACISGQFDVQVIPTRVAKVINTTTAANSSEPRYRASYLDVFTLETPQAAKSPLGVLIESTGSIQALWLTHQCKSGQDAVKYGQPTQQLLR